MKKIILKFCKLNNSTHNKKIGTLLFISQQKNWNIIPDRQGNDQGNGWLYIFSLYFQILL